MFLGYVYKMLYVGSGASQLRTLSKTNYLLSDTRAKFHVATYRLFYSCGDFYDKRLFIINKKKILQSIFLYKKDKNEQRERKKRENEKVELLLTF